MLILFGFIGFVILCITIYSILEISLQYKQNLAQLKYSEHQCRYCKKMGVHVKKDTQD